MRPHRSNSTPGFGTTALLLGLIAISTPPRHGNAQVGAAVPDELVSIEVDLGSPVGETF